MSIARRQLTNADARRHRGPCRLVLFALLAPCAASSLAVAQATPHPAVVRVVAPEAEGAVSYGSGTLVDVRDDCGLVITNWHVVRDAVGDVEVQFPGGFRSQARPLKVDADWDLAALVVWRPPAEPVRLAAAAPQPGDLLTICGYGQGEYRQATGRCTKYYAPRADFPEQMVELDAEARQGDSGGPIFNSRGELAGVLFGAGEGTTLGSFGGRVSSFLATLAPDIGQGGASATALAGDAPPVRLPTPPEEVLAVASSADASASVPASPTQAAWRPLPPAAEAGSPLVELARNSLAAVGAAALALQLLRVVR